MKIGVFVVGALRELELCSKSWQFPHEADWHLLTWTRYTDRFVEGSHPADLNSVHRASVKFNSVHVFEKKQAYQPIETDDQQFYWALQGPWFWRQIHKMFRGGYDYYIVLRPDLFLWPIEGRGWPDHISTTKLWTLGPRQDQMFVADTLSMSFLAGVYDWIAERQGKHPDIHSYLDEYFSPHELDMGVDHETLRKAFHYTLARPNSRVLLDEDMCSEVANEVFRRTAKWWKQHTGHEYEGRKTIPRD